MIPGTSQQKYRISSIHTDPLLERSVDCSMVPQSEHSHVTPGCSLEHVEQMYFPFLAERRSVKPSTVFPQFSQWTRSGNVCTYGYRVDSQRSVALSGRLNSYTFAVKCGYSAVVCRGPIRILRGPLPGVLRRKRGQTLTAAPPSLC